MFLESEKNHRKTIYCAANFHRILSRIFPGGSQRSEILFIQNRPTFMCMQLFIEYFLNFNPSHKKVPVYVSEVNKILLVFIVDCFI